MNQQLQITMSQKDMKNHTSEYSLQEKCIFSEATRYWPFWCRLFLSMFSRPQTRVNYLQSELFDWSDGHLLNLGHPTGTSKFLCFHHCQVYFLM